MLPLTFLIIVILFERLAEESSFPPLFIHPFQALFISFMVSIFKGFLDVTEESSQPPPLCGVAAASDAGAPVSFPRLAAQLQMVLRPLFLLYSKHLRQQQYSNSSHELVYLYGHTSTHHGEKNKSLQGNPASQPYYCCSQGRSSQDARKLRQQFLPEFSKL